MKAVAYLKPGLGYIDYPEPEPPATKDWVKIKVCNRTDQLIKYYQFYPTTN